MWFCSTSNKLLWSHVSLQRFLRWLAPAHYFNAVLVTCLATVVLSSRVLDHVSSLALKLCFHVGLLQQEALLCIVFIVCCGYCELSLINPPSTVKCIFYAHPHTYSLTPSCTTLTQFALFDHKTAIEQLMVRIIVRIGVGLVVNGTVQPYSQGFCYN